MQGFQKSFKMVLKTVLPKVRLKEKTGVSIHKPSVIQLALVLEDLGAEFWLAVASPWGSRIQKLMFFNIRRMFRRDSAIFIALQSLYAAIWSLLCGFDTYFRWILSHTHEIGTTGMHTMVS